MSDETAIKDLLEVQYPARLNAGDIDGYVALYDDDVLWGVPNLPDATSREQIGVLLGKILGKVTQTVDVVVDDLLITGDVAIAMAAATGTAARKPDGDPQPLALRVMWGLRRSGSDWKIIRQVGTPKPAG
jgi:ketosteroid isomerase-like protein